jgi:hypothetical protein
MPLIRFTKNKNEGAYLLVTSGEVSCFPESVFGVNDLLLELLDKRFRQQGISYHRLSEREANQLVSRFEQKKRARPNANGDGISRAARSSKPRFYSSAAGIRRFRQRPNR